jgi:prefoldin subunit 5
MTAIAGTPKLLKQEVEYLRTEVERLKAENAELRKSLDTWISIHGPAEKPKP